MNLVLIGYRGTGKSTVGRLLASRLGRTLISTDEEVIRRVGRSISDLVKEFGWEHFRDREAEVCRELAGRDDLVIDTGGGAILRPQNAEVLRRGRVFWLTASVETIRRRVHGDTQRPSLTGTKSFTEEIEEVLREREPKYRAAAHDIIATDHQTPEAVADLIYERFRQSLS